MRLVRRLAKNDTLAEEGEERSNKKRAYGKRKRKAGWKAARWEGEKRREKMEKGTRGDSCTDVATDTHVRGY